MKILKIELENINCLAGKWAIDFTDPSYAEQGHNLFVIHGNTGSGKSSILDAVTLALYGATPRQGYVYKSIAGNAVMTADTGSCFARVTYQCVKGTFVSQWSQHRAGNRANGNLQDAEGVVYPLNDPLNKIYDGKTGARKELANANTSIMQLDYSQFCRSIMLAQGEFSKFLLSDEDERAVILEKLNGTEKYRKIAVKVGDRWSDSKTAKENAKSALDALKGSLPDPEEVQKQQAILDGLNERKEKLSLDKKKLEGLVAWRTSMNEKQQRLQKASAGLEKAQDEKNLFAENEARLARAEKARECVESDTKLQEIRKRKAAEQGELDGLQNGLASAKKTLAASETEKNNFKKAKETSEEFVRENESLWNEIRRLDENVKGAESEKSAAELRQKKAGEELEKAKTNLQALSGKIEKLKPEQERLQQYLNENAKDAELKNVVPQSPMLVKALTDSEKRIADGEKAKDAAGKDLARAEEELSRVGKKKQELLDEQQRLFENDVLVLADVIQKHLTEGAPCPVCGSREHPACKGESTSSADDSRAVGVAEKIRQLNTEMQKVNSEMDRYGLAKDRACNAENAATEEIDSAKRLNEENLLNLKNLWKPWFDFDGTGAEKILNELSSRQKDYEQAKGNFDQVSKELELAQSQLQNASDAVKHCGEVFEEESRLFNAAAEALKNLRDQRKEKFGDDNVETVAAAAADKVKKAAQAYEKAEKTFREAENKCNEMNGRIETLKQSLAADAENLEAALKNFGEILVAKGFADEAAYRASLLPETEFAKLRARKTELENNLASAKRLKEDALEAFETLKKQCSDETPLEELQKSKSQVEKDLLELQTQAGSAKEKVDNYNRNVQLLNETQKDYDAKSAEFVRWDTMRSWFGVRDGSDFATFVQGLTFKSLLKLANKHLRVIKDRYQLVPEGNLGFKIEDAQFDKPRGTTNLSGGEKFLVSLSLALGIADFASRNVRVESLFLDEGFGTLDEELLDSVMDCLKLQQRQGKMLGVITHVNELVDSISQRIAAESLADGHSALSGPGVSRG